MNPASSAVVVHPDWMFRGSVPRFDHALRGVRYDFHYEHAALIGAAFDRTVAQSAASWRNRLRIAALGPALFFGRSNGPWLRYDPELYDENSGCRVRERPAPWNVGDRIWELWSWTLTEPELVSIDRSIDATFSIYFWGPASVSKSDPASWLLRYSATESAGFAKTIATSTPI